MPTHETKASAKILIKKWAIFAAAIAVFGTVGIFGYAPQAANAAGPTGPGSVALGGSCTGDADCTSGLECNSGTCTTPGNGSAGAICQQGSLDAQCSQSPTALTCTKGYCVPTGNGTSNGTCTMNTNTADGCDDVDGYSCLYGTCYNSATNTAQPAGAGATPAQSSAPTIGTLGILVTGATGNSSASLVFGVSPTYTMTATIGGIGANYACTPATCGTYNFVWSDNGKPIPGCTQNYTCSDTIQNATSTSSDSVTYVLTDGKGHAYNSAAVNLTHLTNPGDNSGLSGGGLSFGVVVISEDLSTSPSPFNLSATVGGVTCNSANNSPTATPPTNLCGVYGMAWSANGTPIPGCSNTWNCNYNSPDLSDSVLYTVTSNGTVIGTSGALNITPNTAKGNQSGASGALAPATQQQITSAAAGTSGSATTCTGSGWTCPVVNIITAVTSIVTTFLTWILTTLVLPMMLILLTISPHTLAFAAVILQGWVVVRNILNIVFVLALLFVGLSTLFGLGNFDPQQWLIQIVTNAILINFSLVIAQAILGVADTLQAQFLPANSNALKAIGVALVGSLGKTEYTNAIAGTGNYSTAIGAILGVVVSFFVVLVLAAITAMLAYRIVMLWILLLLSPAAYALNAVPFGGVEKYASQWWKEFICWSFFTPLMALGITLTVVISQTVQQFLLSGANVAFPGTVTGQTSSAVTLTYNVLIIGVVLGLLYGFEKAAKSGSCGAAGVIVDKVSSFGHNTLKGKGAFTAANTARNTVAGATAGLGARLSQKDGAFAKDLGRVLTGTASTLTYDKKLKDQYITNTPGLRLLTKEGREKAHAENEGALKDIHEKRMTGVNASENYKGVQKKRDDEETAKYVDKSPKQIMDFLRAANESEKEVIMKAVARSGKLSRVLDQIPAGTEGYAIDPETGRTAFNEANIRQFIIDKIPNDAVAQGRVRTAVSNNAKKVNQMVAIGLDKTGAGVAQARRDHFDTLSVEDQMKINVSGLPPDDYIATRIRNTYGTLSDTTQKNVDKKLKRWAGIPVVERAQPQQRQRRQQQAPPQNPPQPPPNPNAP